MNKCLLFLVFSIFLIDCSTSRNKATNLLSILEINKSLVDKDLLKLMKTYPNFIIGSHDNYIVWSDSSLMIFDDKIEKSYEEMLKNPSIKDMFKYKYTPFILDTPALNFDPGRIRNEEFFKKMYGQNKSEVEKNLVTVNWLPNNINKKILVTKINGVSDSLQKISDELDTLYHLHKYIDNIGGTYNWRYIAETERLSAHSFGIAIDINIKYSNYWCWDNNNNRFEYKNQIPLEIVSIFEKHGFIWGGKWYHYDTMHFEYRPELL
ncbi:MAG: M15 family metallopeptidase [Bacteroidales bacterium]|nr:M15 family metallopeptidase [Bacteroidales bacterium]